MKFEFPLRCATLQRRYKRFLADVLTPDGQSLTLHCPNTGSMRGCAEPGSRVWYWDSGSPTRKYPCTWELVETVGGDLACINTARPNALVAEAISAGVITELQGYANLRREVTVPGGGSRIDLMLSEPTQPGSEVATCYVEVKNVTLQVGPTGQGAFPDAVSQRASKHLAELADLSRAGHRAVLLYCVAHTGIRAVRPADELDPAYGKALRAAAAAGVEVLAYGAAISEREISLCQPLPVRLD